LLTHLGFDPVDIDTLQQRSGFAIDVLNTALTDLELAGLIEGLPGGRWQRVA
jgi:DNA processing protein